MIKFSAGNRSVIKGYNYVLVVTNLTNCILGHFRFVHSIAALGMIYAKDSGMCSMLFFKTSCMLILFVFKNSSSSSISISDAFNPIIVSEDMQFLLSSKVSIILFV